MKTGQILNYAGTRHEIVQVSDAQITTRLVGKKSSALNTWSKTRLAFMLRAQQVILERRQFWKQGLHLTPQPKAVGSR
ncbi:MAG: hypothetical protein ACR2FI_02510 [Burkholderiales bacterium]|nr:hypothetical protein [Burkholderiales bacterium]MDQ3195822.1 hypothetical protein [Pseudomonadota bacterium]